MDREGQPLQRPRVPAPPPPHPLNLLLPEAFNQTGVGTESLLLAS